MGQTFEPKHRYAKAFGTNMKISAKNATVVCKAIKNKPLNRARRLLVDLDAKTRNLDGKYYSNATHAMLLLLDSCVKNAEFKGLDTGKLFVHASASHGTNIQRRRRKGAFGSQMKTTNMEILLIERGKAKTVKKINQKENPVAVKKEKTAEHAHKEDEHVHQEHNEKTEEVKG
ncbi:MAG TPA: uL22 family ribosomal protein [archaeon]|nr:uL22 family ribosomal protein [archaeon]